MPQVSISNDQNLLQVFIWSQVYCIWYKLTYILARGKSEVAFIMGYVFDIAGLALSPFLLACGVEGEVGGGGGWGNRRISLLVSAIKFGLSPHSTLALFFFSIRHVSGILSTIIFNRLYTARAM